MRGESYAFRASFYPLLLPPARIVAPPQMLPSWQSSAAPLRLDKKGETSWRGDASIIVQQPVLYQIPPAQTPPPPPHHAGKSGCISAPSQTASPRDTVPRRRGIGSASRWCAGADRRSGPSQLLAGQRQYGQGSLSASAALSR